MKYIIVFISIFVGLFVVFYGWNIQSAKDKKNLDSSEINMETDVNKADVQIAEIIESDAYKNAKLDEREAMIRQLLAQMKKDCVIKHYNFYEDSHMFSFEYNDGTLGGIVIEDHNPEMNSGEPMN